MWRSTARSLLTRFRQQRLLLSLSQVPHPQTVLAPSSSVAAPSLLVRFLSAHPDVGSWIPEDTTARLGKNGALSDAKNESSSLSEDSGSDLEKGGAFPGEDDDGLPRDGAHYDLGCPEDGGAEGIEGVVEFDTEKFEEVVSVLRSVEPEALHSTLEELEFVLGEEFAVRLLGVCDLPVDSLIGFFSWAFKRPDFVKSLAVLDLFVEKVTSFPEGTFSQALQLWDVVREVGEEQKVLLTANILNRLIAVFSKHGKDKFVVNVYRRFDEMGCIPDGDTYYLTIHALGKRSWASTAWDICEKMVSSKQFPDSDKVGKIVKFFCKGGKVKGAHMVYLAAKESGKHLPSLYMEILIDYLSRSDDTLDTAIELLDEYAGQSEKPSAGPFVCTISGLCRIKKAQKAKEVLERMMSSGCLPVKVAFNHVITALSKAGDMEDAVSLLKTMRDKGLKPDIRAYNVVMSAFSRAGLMDEARDIFIETKQVHCKLGRVSYHILSRGYCRIDDFESAIKCMNEMKEDGILPNVDDYRKMIQSLCLKALDWSAAEELLEEMKTSGLCLDGHTRALISAVKELEKEEVQFLGEAEV